MKTPFLHLLPPRLAKTHDRLKESIWTVSSQRLNVSVAEAKDHHIPFAECIDHFVPIRDYPYFWGRSFQQAWFKIQLSPAEASDFSHLYWKDQGEATLYLDGIPAGGFDPGHPFVELPREYSDVHVESICCRTGVWVDGEAQGIDDRGSCLQGAFLCKRDNAAWQAYYDYLVLWELLQWMALQDRDLKQPHLFASPMRVREQWFAIHPLVRILTDGLDRAVDAYDREGAEALSGALKPLYEKLQGALPGLRTVLTGHAHIDLVWLWPERIGEAKALHTFSTVNRLMDRYPEFQFGYSQPASYRAVARRSSELMEKVAARIRDGRWEPVGAMEVESDTNMACGEALARCLMIGQKEFERLTGAPSKVVWLPDVFGYSACLPQIMCQSGVEFFFTTKLTWSTGERFPFTSFRWRGHDGSEVLAHVMGYDQDYNSRVTIDQVINPMRGHRQVALHPEVLVPAGYGDGGGGPTEEMCERARRMANLAGIPKVEWGRIDSFFERMRPVANELPIWDGEIYLEFHRGVLTTHVAVKQTFRAFERVLQTLEAAHVVSGRGPIDLHYWRRLVFSQFHDDIPGSSIIEVYEEGLAERRELIGKALMEAKVALGEGSGAFFNPLPLPMRIQVDQKLLDLPALTAKPISQAVAPEIDKTCRQQGKSWTNGRVRFTLDIEGRIEALSFDGREIPMREPLGILKVYPDHPAVFDAWDIDRNSVGNAIPAAGKPQFLGIQESPSQVVISHEWPLTKRSRAVVRHVLSAGSPVLRLECHVDWADDEHLLRIEFGTAYTGRLARFGAPFGSVTRSQRDKTLTADVRFEVPASRWAIVGDDGESSALALLSKDRYGFGCMDGILHSTLVRSAFITQTVPGVVQFPRTDSGLENTENATHKSTNRDKYLHSHSDHGHHVFQMALAWGGLSAPRCEQPAALAETLFAEPVVVAEVAHGLKCPLPEMIGGDTLIPSWIKPEENGKGFLLRLHETRGQRGIIGLKKCGNWRLHRSSLMEESGPEIQDVLPFGPYELVSLRITSGD